MSLGQEITRKAFEEFDWWCRKYDPDGEMDILAKVEAYSKWATVQKRIADLPLELRCLGETP